MTHELCTAERHGRPTIVGLDRPAAADVRETHRLLADKRPRRAGR